MTPNRPRISEVLACVKPVMKRQEADLEVALHYWSGWTASGASPSQGQGRLDVVEIKTERPR